MNIEFNIFKLKPESSTYKKWSSILHMNKNIDSEFIVVGEEQIRNTSFIKIISIEDNQICLIGGLKIDEVAYLVPKEDIYYTSLITEFDIPKQYLDLDTLDNIQKTNEKLVLS